MAHYDTSHISLQGFVDALEGMGWVGNYEVSLPDGSLLDGVPLARTSHGVAEISVVS